MPIHDWTKVYAGLFHDFHQGWANRIKDALNNGVLPKHVSALVEQRMGSKEVDVLTVDKLKLDLDGHSPRIQSALLEPPSASIVRRSSKELYAEKADRVVVKHRLGRTIAVIEIVSPGNKDSRRAFGEFVEKSVAFIRDGVHLMVADLFPPSKRDPQGIHQSIWEPFEDEDKEFEFPNGKSLIVASYNAGREKAAYVNPLAVGDPLPEAALFLTENFWVKVPLEATYNATWSSMPEDFQVYVLTGVEPQDQ